MRQGSLRDLIARVNRIRKENPALQSEHKLRFHETDNPLLLCYSKSTDDLSNVILVVVNLDLFNKQIGLGQSGLAFAGPRRRSRIPGSRSTQRWAISVARSSELCGIDAGNPAGAYPARAAKGFLRSRILITACTRKFPFSSRSLGILLEVLGKPLWRNGAAAQRIRSGTRTRSFTSCTSARSRTAMATASAISRA